MRTDPKTEQICEITRNQIVAAIIAHTNSSAQCAFAIRIIYRINTSTAMLSYNLQSKFHLYLSLAKGHNNIRTEGQTRPGVPKIADTHRLLRRMVLNKQRWDGMFRWSNLVC